MIDNLNITKMVTHILRRNNGAVDPQIMHPMREWLVGIIVTISVGVVGSVTAAVLYHSYDVLRGTEITPIVEATPYKSRQVERALAEYREKSFAYNQLVGKKPQTTVASSTVVISVPTVSEPATTTPIIPITPAAEPVEFPEAVNPAPAKTPASSETDTSSSAPDLAI